jgi:hypothetical protein
MILAHLMKTRSSLAPAPLIFPVSGLNHLPQRNLVEVGNGLEDSEGRILFAVLNLIHVAVMDANLSGHILVRQSSFYTQLRNHCPKCSLWRVSLTF